MTTATWPWRRMNEGNASAHATLVALVEPQSGERWLDVGTGGGGLALELARAGADVTAVDVAADGLEHAREAAAEAGLAATFEVADACALPYDDASFDGVASAFGVIFAASPGDAAAELARVCRPGGRLGLALMPADSRAAGIWSALLFHGHPGPHPAAWDSEVESRLGDAFALERERRESPLSGVGRRLEWDEWVRTFPPLRELAVALDEAAVAALRADVEAVDAAFASRAASYVVVLGRRR